jgi:hypothetical protein
MNRQRQRENPEKQKMANNLNLYMAALGQLDSLDADSRALNQFRISLFKEYADQEFISNGQYDSIAKQHFRAGNMIVDVIRAATSNADESEISLDKINELTNLFHQYPVLKKGDKNSSQGVNQVMGQSRTQVVTPLFSQTGGLD